MDKRIGNYSFVIGVILALILGVVPLGPSTPWLTSLLVLLGIVVGFLNVTSKEVKDFLLVAVVLIIAASLGGSTALANVEMIGEYLTGIFSQLLAFIVPATIVVALKEIWALAQSS